MCVRECARVCVCVCLSTSQVSVSFLFPFLSSGRNVTVGQIFWLSSFFLFLLYMPQAHVFSFPSLSFICICFILTFSFFFRCGRFCCLFPLFWGVNLLRFWALAHLPSLCRQGFSCRSHFFYIPIIFLRHPALVSLGRNETLVTLPDVIIERDPCHSFPQIGQWSPPTSRCIPIFGLVSVHQKLVKGRATCSHVERLTSRRE